MKNIFLVVALTFFIILSGCYTYYPASERPESLKKKKNEYLKIQKFYLVNGDSVDLKDFDVKYYEKYKNFEKVFVCVESKTFRDNEMFSNYKKDEKIIPAEQVKSAEIEKKRFNTLKTILNVSIGIVITSGVLFWYMLFLSHHSTGKLG